MPLQIHHTDPGTNADFPAAFCRIDQASLPTLDGPLDVVVGVYVDSGSASGGFLPVQVRRASITGTALDTLRQSFAAQVYQYLKTLPEYQGATDAP